MLDAGVEVGSKVSIGASVGMAVGSSTVGDMVGSSDVGSGVGSMVSIVTNDDMDVGLIVPSSACDGGIVGTGPSSTVGLADC